MKFLVHHGQFNAILPMYGQMIGMALARMGERIAEPIGAPA